MKDLNKLKRQKRMLRHGRVRSRLVGTAQKPRLSVFRANKHIYAQVVDDSNGKTLVAASSSELKMKGKKTQTAEEVGKLVAKKSLDKKINSVVFDRGGYQYHGRVKALAEAARKAGLKF